MKLEQRLQQSVRANKGEDDEDVYDDGNDVESSDGFADEDLTTGDLNSPGVEDANSTEQPDTEKTEDEAEPESNSAFAEISFGALAAAQESLGASLKRKRPVSDATSSRKRQSRSPSPFHEAKERRKAKDHSTSKHKRSSKHAPVEMSSKMPVSRKRVVVEAASKPQARDPRFSSLSGTLDENTVKRNYAFLDDYRASEMGDLRAKIKQERNDARKEALRKQLKAMEDRDRARQKVEEERRVVSEHRKQERDAVKQGKKPFFLKQSDVKKQVLQKKFEGMSEKRAERVMEKRRKRKAQKERKNMPDARRTET